MLWVGSLSGLDPGKSRLTTCMGSMCSLSRTFLFDCLFTTLCLPAFLKSTWGKLKPLNHWHFEPLIHVGSMQWEQLGPFPGPPLPPLPLLPPLFATLDR